MERILEQSSLPCVGEAEGRGTLGVSDLPVGVECVQVVCAVWGVHGYLDGGVEGQRSIAASAGHRVAFLFLVFFFF